jgi:hypothetical protein
MTTQEGETPPIDPAKLEKMNRKRKRLAQELLETETTYVSNLKELLEFYYQPLKENSELSESERIISPDDVKDIFSSLRTIIPMNETLLEALQAAVNVPDSEQIIIGEAFMRIVCQSFYSNFNPHSITLPFYITNS